MSNKACHPDFSKWVSKLLNTHLPTLFSLERFRSLLETEQWTEALELCKKAVQHGIPALSEVGKTRFMQLSQGTHCENVWPVSLVSECLNCATTLPEGEQVKVVWLERDYN